MLSLQLQLARPYLADNLAVPRFLISLMLEGLFGNLILALLDRTWLGVLFSVCQTNLLFDYLNNGSI